MISYRDNVVKSIDFLVMSAPMSCTSNQKQMIAGVASSDEDNDYCNYFNWRSDIVIYQVRWFTQFGVWNTQYSACY